MLGVKNKHIVFVCILLGMLQACTPKKSLLPDLRESFSYLDTKPFGTSVAYSIFKTAYPKNDK